MWDGGDVAKDMAVAEQSENGTAPTKSAIMFSLPPELRQKIEADAEQDSVSASSIVRKIVAAHYGFDLPARTRRSRYANDDERKAAARAASQRRNDLIKALLADYKAKQAEKAAATA